MTAETSRSVPMPPLAALAQDQAPARDLWPAIEARLALAAEHGGGPDSDLRQLAGLARDRAPARDLWPAIEAQIALRQRQRRTAPWLAAAALAASLVIVLGLRVSRDPLPHRAPLRAPVDLLAADEPRNPALMQTATRPLRSETRALVRANLKIVNGAEAQLERALAEEPNAAYLHSLLATTRQQQRELRVALGNTELAAAGER